MIPRLLFSVITALSFSAFSGGTVSAHDSNHSAFTSILKRYVDGRGMVDYAGLKRNRSGLDRYLAGTAAVSKREFDRWNEKAQIAFLVNVYNAETLQLIIDNYPTKSIKDIGGFLQSPFKMKVVDLFGEKTDLATVEKGMIIKNYDEPRTHFSLVCAAMGCPPLRREAITASRFDYQHNDQARIFLNQKNKNYVGSDGMLYLSSIFKTYSSDFEKKAGTVQNFVNPWFRGDVRDKKIEYTDYDWDLNDQATANR